MDLNLEGGLSQQLGPLLRIALHLVRIAWAPPPSGGAVPNLSAVLPVSDTDVLEMLSLCQ